MTKAARLLAIRPRTERELRERLAQGGHSPCEVDTTIARLVELELVDDAAFARQWVEESAARKGLGGHALRAELLAKGVAPELAQEVVAAASDDEEARAVEVASRFVRRVARFPLAEQPTRLHQMLLRRGFSHEAAGAGARAVLPPEGWD